MGMRRKGATYGQSQRMATKKAETANNAEVKRIAGMMGGSAMMQDMVRKALRLTSIDAATAKRGKLEGPADPKPPLTWKRLRHRTVLRPQDDLHHTTTWHPTTIPEVDPSMHDPTQITPFFSITPEQYLALPDTVRNPLISEESLHDSKRQRTETKTTIPPEWDDATTLKLLEIVRNLPDVVWPVVHDRFVGWIEQEGGGKAERYTTQRIMERYAVVVEAASEVRVNTLFKEAQGKETETRQHLPREVMGRYVKSWIAENIPLQEVAVWAEKLQQIWEKLDTLRPEEEAEQKQRMHQISKIMKAMRDSGADTVWHDARKQSKQCQQQSSSRNATIDEARLFGSLYDDVVRLQSSESKLKTRSTFTLYSAESRVAKVRRVKITTQFARLMALGVESQKMKDMIRSVEIWVCTEPVFNLCTELREVMRTHVALQETCVKEARNVAKIDKQTETLLEELAELDTTMNVEAAFAAEDTVVASAFHIPRPSKGAPL